MLKKGTYHTFEFLENRQNDPKWREAYLQAKKSRRIETLVILVFSVIVFTIVAFLFFNRTSKDEKDLNTSKQSSEYKSESSVIKSSETTDSTTKSTSTTSKEGVDETGSTDTVNGSNGFVVKPYTFEEKSRMTEEFLTWSSERAIIGGMAVHSAYFTHGASGMGDWYTETPDGLVLVQQQHPEGRPGYDYYSIHAVGGVIFYYSVFGTVGRTDEVNQHDGTIAAGYSLVADRNKPIVKYMLCDNGVVYEMKSTGGLH